MSSVEKKENESKKHKSKELNILLLSDIHFSITNVKKVKKYIDDNKLKIDLLLMPGDFLSLKGDDYTDKSKIKQSKLDIIKLFKECQTIFKEPIVIPGNVRTYIYIYHKYTKIAISIFFIIQNIA